MGVKGGSRASQNTMRNSEVLLIQLPTDAPDGLTWWLEQYFRFEVTTAISSQKVQRRDLELFLRFLRVEEKTDARVAWTPRLSRDFQTYLQRMLREGGGRVWSDSAAIYLSDCVPAPHRFRAHGSHCSECLLSPQYRQASRGAFS